MAKAPVQQPVAPVAEDKTPKVFLTIAEFKSKFGISKIDIVNNPATGKLFGIITFNDKTTGTMKVEQAWETKEGEPKAICDLGEEDDSDNFGLAKCAPGLIAIDSL